MGGTSLNQTMFLLGARPPAVTQGEDIAAVFHDVKLVQFDVQYRCDLLIYSDRLAEHAALVLFYACS